ncbi:hypothetical protein PVOR_28939 [Paenibacillus vortex V453]|uniref:Uncharacterized protein n=1 Tax=Paenibacillus vortex V453 TaxID=715225 RepID=A0A2R9SMQ7_9BACL|nr:MULTISPECIES: hypothetical protein [Paenibacillus]EFU38639.1 hypothetical protein PVOR_28939 [Paenibacillus vortex V453]MDH6673532.1 hypothetical protein [Paenibacillus sp. LBL]
MSVDKERGSGSTEQQLDQQKTNIDIYKLMTQMGIHPDKWLQMEELHKD